METRLSDILHCFRTQSKAEVCVCVHVGPRLHSFMSLDSLIFSLTNTNLQFVMWPTIQFCSINATLFVNTGNSRLYTDKHAYTRSHKTFKQLCFFSRGDITSSSVGGHPGVFVVMIVCVRVCVCLNDPMTDPAYGPLLAKNATSKTSGENSRTTRVETNKMTN